MTEQRFTKCGTKIRDNGEEMSQAEVRDLLNEQHETIQKLKEANQGLQFKIIDMLDFVKSKGSVTRQEIKEWWNKEVME